MDYILIRAWGQYQALPNAIIRDELATAREDKAPTNALYKNIEGVWVTIEAYKGITRTNIERTAAAIQRRDNPTHPHSPPRTII